MAEINITAEETGPESPTETVETPQPKGSEEKSLTIEDKVQIPDKFVNEDGTVNVENLVKSYAEMEKRHSGEKKEEPEVAAKTPENKKFTENEIASMREEMETEGKLSEKTIGILAEHGMPSHMAESYIQGQTLLAEQINTKIMAPVGGEENYQQLLEWASENLSQEDIDSYDKIMIEGDINQKILAVEGLAARQNRNNPSPPKQIMGNTNNVQTSSAFSSWDQVKRAMRDPRYQTDETYRESVTERLGRSNF